MDINYGNQIAVRTSRGLFSSVVTIYEEGVIIKKGRKERKLHFSEIAGLVDSDDGGTVVPVVGGVIGAVVIGTAAGLISNAVDANRRNRRLRSITIMPVTPMGFLERAGISVPDTAGDELSEVYTEWAVKTKNINKENINSLQISFGDKLSIDNGAFVSKTRRGEERFEFERITELDIRADSIMFFGPNEKGKEKCLIDTKILRTYNLDLLFYIYGMIYGSEEEESPVS